MNYRNSLLALAIASGLSAAPAAQAVDLGTYNDTSFSIGGYLKAEGIFEDPETGDSRFFGRANQSRFNLKTVTQKQGQTWTGQFWAVAHTDYLDFLGGPRGTLGGLNFRTPLASYEFAGFRVSAQDPVYNDADIPDLAVNYTLNSESGHKLILTASGREVDDQAETDYEAHRVNLIHNIIPELEVGVEWRKYNLAFGPLIPEGQQVEVMAKYSF